MQNTTKNAWESANTLVTKLKRSEGINLRSRISSLTNINVVAIEETKNIFTESDLEWSQKKSFFIIVSHASESRSSSGLPGVSRRPKMLTTPLKSYSFMSRPTMTDHVSYKGDLADWAVAVLFLFFVFFRSFSRAIFTNMHLALFSFLVVALALSVQQAISIPFDKRAAPAPAPPINGMYCYTCIFQNVSYWNVY